MPKRSATRSKPTATQFARRSDSFDRRESLAGRDGESIEVYRSKPTPSALPIKEQRSKRLHTNYVSCQLQSGYQSVHSQSTAVACGRGFLSVICLYYCWYYHLINQVVVRIRTFTPILYFIYRTRLFGFVIQGCNHSLNTQV